MSIILPVSLDWEGSECNSVVGHSFRVMAKAKNDDEEECDHEEECAGRPF